ncbi:MAG: hypothetical protein H7228_02650 [Polaromonas sp.]|nr:hypothetical protein [Polaromonas sp.]
MQVREKLRSLVAENRECGSGSCWTATGYEICYYIGGLDRQLDYQISNGSNDRKPKPKMEISPSDLKNLQLMFSQCRLRDFPSLLQVVYVPTKRFEKRINSWLDVEK